MDENASWRGVLGGACGIPTDKLDKFDVSWFIDCWDGFGYPIGNWKPVGGDVE